MNNLIRKTILCTSLVLTILLVVSCENETGVLRFNSRKIGVNEKFKITHQSSFARNGEQKFQYFISHAKFSELDVNDITNELSITANNGGQQALFNIEILN